MKEEYRSLVVPFLQRYTVEEDANFWELSLDTRIICDEKSMKFIERIEEILMISGIDSAIDTSLEVATMKDSIVSDKDITIFLVESNGVTTLSSSAESYRITIGKTGVCIYLSTIETLLPVFYTLKQLWVKLGNRLLVGEIIDYPDLKERRLHIDIGRKYFSKDWIIKQIQHLSELKMNTLQLHFSENKGFRIESTIAPGIVSRDGFLTKKEVKEILLSAKKYGVQIIPSLDTPGHVEHILKTYPNLGQEGINGELSKVALDITSEKSLAFIKKLYSEYMELFSECQFFHIGADEYMEFDRAPFTTVYQPVLNNFAKEKWGTSYGWKDVVANYVNQVAEHVYKNGFIPRVWNDGVYYDEKEIYEPRQKIELEPYITVDFWSQMGWNPSVAELDTFFQRGIKEVYNVNASFFYYVLRPDKPTDGRLSHSFDFLEQDRRIYEDWHAGLFESNEIPNRDSRIGGASLAIWCDQPEIASEERIALDISNELVSFATKTWNGESNYIQSFKDFKKAFLS
ncbi:family 20 glycosylhydrolase [Enterococcus sp. LJL98]